jgi:hypothetical protein
MDVRATIFQQHTPRLYGIAYRRLGSRADAEDARALGKSEVACRQMVHRAGARRVQGKATYQVAPINGEPGLIIRLDGRLHWVLSIDTDGVRILAVYNILNPQKLKGITLPVSHAP